MFPNAHIIAIVTVGKIALESDILTESSQPQLELPEHENWTENRRELSATDTNSVRIFLQNIFVSNGSIHL